MRTRVSIYSFHWCAIYMWSVQHFTNHLRFKPLGEWQEIRYKSYTVSSLRFDLHLHIFGKFVRTKTIWDTHWYYHLIGSSPTNFLFLAKVAATSNWMNVVKKERRTVAACRSEYFQNNCQDINTNASRAEDTTICEDLLQAKSWNQTGRVHMTNMDRNVPIAAKISEAKRTQTNAKNDYGVLQRFCLEQNIYRVFSQLIFFLRQSYFINQGYSSSILNKRWNFIKIGFNASFSFLLTSLLICSPKMQLIVKRKL